VTESPGKDSVPVLKSHTGPGPSTCFQTMNMHRNRFGWAIADLRQGDLFSL